MKRYEPFNELNDFSWDMSGEKFDNEDDAIVYALNNDYEYIYDEISDTWKRVHDIQTNF